MVHKIENKSKGYYDEELIREGMRMGLSLESAKSNAWVEKE